MLLTVTENIMTISENVKVDVMVEADRSSKNKRGNSYLKVEKIKLKVFIGGANGRLVNTNKNVRSENFGEYTLS